MSIRSGISSPKQGEARQERGKLLQSRVLFPSSHCFLPTTEAVASSDKLFSEALVEEMGDLFECLLSLGGTCITVVLRVRLAFIDLQHRVYTSLPQLAMRSHRIA